VEALWHLILGKVDSCPLKPGSGRNCLCLTSLSTHVPTRVCPFPADTSSWDPTHDTKAAVLGSGSFGSVFAVRHADSHKLDELDYALKVIDMKDLREARGMADNSKMLAEVVTLAKLPHGHHIARYFHAQEFPRASADEPNIADFLVIRLELCKGGTIRQLLDDCLTVAAGTATVYQLSLCANTSRSWRRHSVSWKTGTLCTAISN